MFENVKYEILQYVKDIEFNGIEYDSRRINKNNIFVAMRGTNANGNDYICSAIKNGATTVITDNKDIDISQYKDINFYYVENLRFNLGKIASNLYGYPQKKIKILGVTGTNGKTTSTYILENILENTSRIGTTNYRILDKIYEATNTTPESLDLIKLLDESVKKNVDYFIMEVSSHALSMGRCDMLEFDGAIFTNLTQDHLDYHKTMEKYFEAKARILNLLKDNAKLSINTDDKIVSKLKGDKTISFGMQVSDIIGHIIKTDNQYMYAKIEYMKNVYKFKTKLMGEHNLYNILGVVSMLTNLGYDIKYILDKIEKIDYVPGRFELIENNINAKIVVDYAHTPDGLDKALKTLKNITGKKVYTVFGAGGNRDATKRSKMAEAALKYSDWVILTSDNPRNENPYDILEDIEKGFIQNNYKTYYVIEDRACAIKKAISYLKENDSLLIAGKGHENYQIVKGEKKYFSDKEEVLKCIENMKKHKEEELEKSKNIIKYIADSKKVTPCTLITDEKILNSYNLKVIGKDLKYIIGDYEIIKKIIDENKLVNYILENDRRNSKVPLLDIKNINARIEPGAIIRDMVEIGDNAIIMMGAIINIGAKIGENSMIDMGVVMGGRASVGKNCHIGAGTVLAGVIEPPSADPVIIEDNVVIGANSVILEGVRVRKNSVVAAGSIVTEDVPESFVVAGAPAKIVKRVDDKTLSKTEILEELR